MAVVYAFRPQQAQLIGLGRRLSTTWALITTNLSYNFLSIESRLEIRTAKFLQAFSAINKEYTMFVV